MIESQDFPARHARLRALIAKHDYGAYLAVSTDEIFYLTGAVFVPIERPVLLLVTADGALRIVAPLLERDHIGAQVPDAEVVLYRDYPSPPGETWQKRLLELADSSGPVAVDPYARVEITAVLGARATPEHFVDRLRAIKSPGEIARIRRAAFYADAQVAKMQRAIRAGLTAGDVYAAIGNVTADAAAELGSRYTPFTTSCMSLPWAAPYNAEPHRIPAMSDRFDAQGPHNMTAMARFDGYAAESERVLFLTPPSGDLAQAHHAVCGARALAWSMLRPGQSTSEIDTAVRDHLRTAGFGQFLMHRTGHGFGLGAHEGPWLAEGATDVLAENMVVSVEPGLYLPGVGGLRDSDTILITADGYEILTHAPYQSPLAEAA